MGFGCCCGVAVRVEWFVAGWFLPGRGMIMVSGLKLRDCIGLCGGLWC